MGAFLRDNWIWIVAPIALFAGLIAVVIVLNSSSDAGHIYVIW